MDAFAIRLARIFHHNYERLAPKFGYATREDTRHFDPGSTNGKLMIATCEAVIESLVPLDDVIEAALSVPAQITEGWIPVAEVEVTPNPPVGAHGRKISWLTNPADISAGTKLYAELPPPPKEA